MARALRPTSCIWLLSSLRNSAIRTRMPSAAWSWSMEGFVLATRWGPRLLSETSSQSFGDHAFQAIPDAPTQAVARHVVVPALLATMRRRKHHSQRDTDAKTGGHAPTTTTTGAFAIASCFSHSVSYLLQRHRIRSPNTRSAVSLNELRTSARFSSLARSGAFFDCCLPFFP